MSLPRFLHRVVDAAAPFLGGLDRKAIQEKLDKSSVMLVAGDQAAEEPHRSGFLLAANLAARLYPRIGLEGPADLVDLCEQEIALINPCAEIVPTRDASATLGFERTVQGASGVSVFSRGWNVHLDERPVGRTAEQTAVPAALSAAALGIGELFRVVFSAELQQHGRRGTQPGAVNLVTLGEVHNDLVVPGEVDVGEFRLVGAGAIGQAAANALALAGVRGKMVAVDDEKVALSNLQRYVLTRDPDVDAVKVELLRERLHESQIEVVPVEAKWHAGLVREQRPTLVALDSAEARIGVQASLPGPIYNAWTQPGDIGWSRHEHLGKEPCLACLYWPTARRPSRHEQIAAAFRQHPLRILAYLVHREIPIGLPLPPGGIPAIPGLEAPAEAERWLSTPLVDDIATAAGVDVSELGAWRESRLADVYQDGICGGALLHLDVGEVPREVLVPLAHQSALAGAMLATQLIVAAIPSLKAARNASVEGRYDVLSGFPQVLARPRMRTAGCLCGDSVYLSVYRKRFGPEAVAPSGEEAGEEDV